MSASEDPDLGRRRGVFVPFDDVQAHELCGWRLVDDLAGMSDAGDVVLMQPPKEIEGAA